MKRGRRFEAPAKLSEAVWIDLYEISAGTTRLPVGRCEKEARSAAVTGILDDDNILASSVVFDHAVLHSGEPARVDPIDLPSRPLDCPHRSGKSNSIRYQNGDVKDNARQGK